MAEITPIKYDPKKRNLYIFDIEGIPPFAVVTGSRPRWSFDEVEIPIFNGKFFIPGKMSPEPLELTINDVATADIITPLYEWSRQVYDPDTGAMGYMEEYTRNIILTILGYKGEELEVWEIRGAWIQNFNGGDLDQTSGEPIQVNITLRYQDARLIRSGGTNLTAGTGSELFI